MRIFRVRTFLLVILVTLLVACGGAETAPPTIDTGAIAATVAAQLAEVATSADSTAVPTVMPINHEPSAAVAESNLEGSLVDVYQQANPSVVYIIVPPLGSGSGFVYNDEGYIVTNNHVVAGGQRYEVVFADGERREATLVGSDPDSDLAVLKVDRLPDGVEPLPLAETTDLKVGQFVIAIGNPFGEQGSMSLGIISALGRSLPSQRPLNSGSSYSLPEVIQTDAPINPGNSGGPLLNLAGEVVGVNSAIATTNGMNSGVGFAIPVQAVRQIVPSLISDGRYAYPYIGAGFDEEVSLAEQETFGLPQTRGAYVMNVTPGGPAAAAGLIGADPTTGQGGDLVIAIDGRPVDDFSDLNSYLIFHASVGQTIELTVLRAGETEVLSVTLAQRP